MTIHPMPTHGLKRSPADVNRGRGRLSEQKWPHHGVGQTVCEAFARRRSCSRMAVCTVEGLVLSLWQDGPNGRVARARQVHRPCPLVCLYQSC